MKLDVVRFLDEIESKGHRVGISGDFVQYFPPLDYKDMVQAIEMSEEIYLYIQTERINKELGV